MSIYIQIYGESFYRNFYIFLNNTSICRYMYFFQFLLISPLLSNNYVDILIDFKDEMSNNWV